MSVHLQASRRVVKLIKKIKKMTQNISEQPQYAHTEMNRCSQLLPKSETGKWTIAELKGKVCTRLGENTDGVVCFICPQPPTDGKTMCRECFKSYRKQLQSKKQKKLEISKIVEEKSNEQQQQKQKQEHSQHHTDVVDALNRFNGDKDAAIRFFHESTQSQKHNLDCAAQEIAMLKHTLSQTQTQCSMLVQQCQTLEKSLQTQNNVISISTNELAFYRSQHYNNAILQKWR